MVREQTGALLQRRGLGHRSKYLHVQVVVGYVGTGRLSATRKINRRDFGIDTELPLDGCGVVIGDTVEISPDPSYSPPDAAVHRVLDAERGAQSPIYRVLHPERGNAGSYRYWPVLVAVSIARPESAFLPVTRVRM
jgi:hypothetical protein